MPWSVVAHLIQGSPDKQGFTSDPCDTTGANLLVFAGVNIDSFDISDNKGNTWVLAVENGSSYYKRTFVAVNPIVGTGHTFTIDSVDGSPSMIVVAVKDADLTAPIDQTNNNGGYYFQSSPGPVTPTADGELIITSTLCDGEEGVCSIDSGFTIIDQMPATFGAHWGIALAILDQSTAATVEPLWSVDPNNLVGSTIVSFKAGSGVVPPPHKDLLGSASGTAVTTATPSRKRRLVGASSGIALDTAAISRRRSLVGASNGVASTTATTSRKRALTATSVGVATTTALISDKRLLTGSAAGKATTNGTISRLGSTQFLAAQATATAQSQIAAISTGTKFSAVLASATAQSNVATVVLGTGFLAQLMQSTASTSVVTYKTGAVWLAQAASVSGVSQSAVMRTSNGILASVALCTSASLAANIVSGVRITAGLMSANAQMEFLTVALSGKLLAQLMQATLDTKIVAFQQSNKLLAQIMLANALSQIVVYKSEGRWFAATALVTAQLRVAKISETFTTTSPGPDIIYAQYVVPSIVSADVLIPYLYYGGSMVPSIVSGDEV